MAKPTTREEFKEYILRRLGKGAICIDVTPEQVDDRVDDAIEFFNTYHYNGTRRIFLKHQITQEDKDNGYIPIADGIENIVNIMNVSTSNVSSTNMFNARYQFVLQNLGDLANYDLVNYYLMLQHYAFMEEILVGAQPIEFNRFDDKLYIHARWNDLQIGQYIVAEAYERINPDNVPEAWSELWLQDYAAAKIKYQWGSNLSKFEGVQMLGGVQFNGLQIMQDAETDLLRLQEEIPQMPPRDMIG